MIDTHCHLNFKSFNKDYQQVYKRAKDNGVKKIIVVGARLDSSEKAAKLAQQLEDAYASIGVHPYHVDELIKLGKERLENQLKKLSQKKKVIAIGETGLDFFRYKKDLANSYSKEEIKKLQQELLLLHLKLAKEKNLPLIVHCRAAMQELINFLSQSFKQWQWQPKGVFHCFNGDKNQLKQVINMGFYVGFDGNITYEENVNLRQRVKETPLGRLLIETDAPFLTPQPYRRSRNEPGYVKLVAEAVAKIKNLSVKQVVKHTTENALKLFRL